MPAERSRYGTTKVKFVPGRRNLPRVPVGVPHLGPPTMLDADRPGQFRRILGNDCVMAVRAFHPILYVADPYAERDFFGRFGFETVYEGDEFPGFLAVECGPVRFGLSNNSDLPQTGAHDGVRWQFLVDDVDEVTSVCAAAYLPCEIVVEEGGTTHRSRIAKVTSPNGVQIWFEGPNELG
jgi:hypothetical protein